MCEICLMWNMFEIPDDDEDKFWEVRVVSDIKTCTVYLAVYIMTISAALSSNFSLKFQNIQLFSVVISPLLAISKVYSILSYLNGPSFHRWWLRKMESWIKKLKIWKNVLGGGGTNLVHALLNLTVNFHKTKLNYELYIAIVR